jgi:uncharacterized membrane protein YgdD (TMEM256/DUF423 family)
MTAKVLILAAALMGASGVILAAVAAHTGAEAGVESAAYLLLFHAVAVLAGVGLLENGSLWDRPLVLALAGWVLGAALFAVAVTLHAFTGQRLFPMAAPAGGTILIASWLALAVAALGAAT